MQNYIFHFYITIVLKPILIITIISGKYLLCSSGGQSTQIKYLSKSTDTYTKILLQ